MRLLYNKCHARKTYESRRPIFLTCHTTATTRIQNEKTFPKNGTFARVLTVWPRWNPK